MDLPSQLADAEGTVWVVAVLAYGAGDTLTTWVGLRSGRGAEAGPLAAPLVETYGILGLVGLKVVTLALFYLTWRVARPPARVAVPLAVALVGVGVTAWNLAVVSA
ncbi:DUF5658 family protein [Salinirubellus salinus]|uniref:DUF5658 family protein n=1 Tax=Salinirubellus salinus TaxID=1364945 RepID=A0A9E7R608_9EURY|nr:DUF5658 family protein [Salinirubellus salinus]UWM56555.1 DUF5658 family protein [Salinirubellus salinus]